jgi:VanZ family protein
VATNASQLHVESKVVEMLPQDLLAQLKLQTLLKIATAGYVIMYLISSHHHAASPDSLGLPTNFDKLIHFGVYFLMSCLLTFAIDNRHSVNGHRSWASFGGLTMAAFALIGISLLDELSQPWFGRHFDWLDLAFDWAGIVSGLIVCQSACLVWDMILPSGLAANNSVD